MSCLAVHIFFFRHSIFCTQVLRVFTTPAEEKERAADGGGSRSRKREGKGKKERIQGTYCWMQYHHRQQTQLIKSNIMSLPTVWFQNLNFVLIADFQLLNTSRTKFCTFLSASWDKVSKRPNFSGTWCPDNAKTKEHQTCRKPNLWLKSWSSHHW